MVRIVFVDDDERVLSGIKRSLRSQRDQWDMEFLPSAQEALTACANRPPDVVVTDLRMPGMDGEALLRRLADEHPHAVRIVLSGMADAAVSMRTIHVAHQFLAKPCESEQLQERLSRVVGLRKLLEDEGLRRDLGSLDALPPAPKIYTALQQVTARDDVSTDDVAEIIQQDPAMSVMVLKVVNSAFVGLPRTVTTVDRAVVLLGVRMVEDIVLAADAARSVSPGSPQLLDAFQHHSAATAMLAQKIAPVPLMGAARTAGFLHDLGGLFLAARRGPALTALARQAALDHTTMHDALQQHWHLAPAELGAYLLGMWGLPLELVDSVAASAQPRWRSLGLAELLHISDALIHELVEQPTPFSSAPALDLDGLRALGMVEQLPVWRKRAERVVFG
jgi:HD-like signal output (HDOD) protein/ActR/RegA family two-component response regulator